MASGRDRSTPAPKFACRLCGSGELRPYYTLGSRGEFKYYKCPRCDLVNYDLSGGLDQTQYEELIDPLDDGAQRNLDKDRSWAFVRRYLTDSGRFLDIGCGPGRLLYLAKRDGWAVKGLELSRSMAEFASRRIDAQVDVGDFLQLDLVDSGYDLISLRHVLEHLIDPIVAMTRIRTLLNPGGHVLLEFPNIEALDKRIKRVLVNAGLHKRSFSEDFVAGHCNEFCRSSFVHLLGKTGFSLVRWETYSHKPLANFIYNHVHIGNKVRTLVRADEAVTRSDYL